MMQTQAEIARSRALLHFLGQFVRLRRKRKTGYGDADKVLWIDELAAFKEHNEVRCPFFEGDRADFTDIWLQLKRPVISGPPAVPPELMPLIGPQDLRNPGREPMLGLGSGHEPANNGAPPSTAQARLWREYLERHWRPWADRARRLSQLQKAYEDLDFMRRRMEESEETYELVLGLGLVLWADPSGEVIRRHMFVAPAEISLEARSAVLSVTPAATLDRFAVELDMFQLQHRPRLDRHTVDRLLDQLTGEPWNIETWEDLAKEIANRMGPHARVIADPWRESVTPDQVLRVYYAPALILRQRRPLAYDELVEKLAQQAETENGLAVTDPWLQLIREGAGPDSDAGDPPPSSAPSTTRLYFPLPTNDEQRLIAQRLQERPYVLVKGPPGTGKSHTIANLICHLLAQGERVLITAHAPKALEVLLELLPAKIATLCVTALGSTREDHRRLEDSVRTILARKDRFPGVPQSEAWIEQIEQELRELEGKLARLDREIREYREAETYPHSLPAGYEGTAAQIARALEKDGETYHWLPDVPSEDSRCPLRPEEVAFLAEMHSQLNEAKRRELALEINAEFLPTEDKFTAALDELAAAEQAYREACTNEAAGEPSLLNKVNTEALMQAHRFLTQLREQAVIARQRLGAMTETLLADLLAGKRDEWATLASEFDRLLRRMEQAIQNSGGARVDLPGDVPLQQLKADAQRRFEHFVTGGLRGFGPLAPRVVRETRYVEAKCRVNGRPPREAHQLEQLIAFVQFEEAFADFKQLWRGALDVPGSSQHVILSYLTAAVEQLRRILKLFEDSADEALIFVEPGARQSLCEEEQRSKWLKLVDAQLARRRLEAARSRLDGWLTALDRMVATKNSHPCMLAIRAALATRDAQAYADALQRRERVGKEKERLDRYEGLISRLQQEHPALVERLRAAEGDLSWKGHLINLDRAWAWAAARTWLRKFSDPERYQQLTLLRHSTQQQMEKKLLELASEKAWLHFFKGLNEATRQNLTAWAKAVARIGAGTGVHASYHRRQARQYLVRCLPSIPAWIMPFHKVWETVEPQPGLFDTVIVDEASQAGVDSLLILLLAKRIVVVGDDQQNAPEAVGIAEEDINRLIREYLGGFTFAAEYRPDTSLYDHAERAFGQPISLREHFRCVPEIIRFSNDLCYRQAPLIPLRQPPPERLVPILTNLVPQGRCEGYGQNLINRAEAEEIVARIRECVKDERYADKSIGVIVLQGRAQAELIEEELVKVLTPKERQDHKIRCGVPATFQGDQRDVIFLSMVVAPNHPFRALTELEARRRFNVAMSRARDQVWLFHSVNLSDLSPDDLRHKLLDFCLNWRNRSESQQYGDWERLEREVGTRPRSKETQPGPYESWFEVDVALELLRRGYRLIPQYEFAGYRIDLVVEGYGNRLAIECDGDEWHGPEQYERDLHRQRQLERAGWNFVRVRASEFYANRERAIHRIVEACQELDIFPRPVGPCPSAETPDIAASSGEGWDSSLELFLLEDEKELANHRPLEQSEFAAHFPDPRVAPPGAVREALLELIGTHGPLNKRLLYRHYAENCPQMGRTTQTIRSLLNRALYQLQRSSQVVVVDELGDRTLESQVVRLANSLPVRVRPRSGRDLLEIPPSELLSVSESLRSSLPTGSDREEQMMRAILRFYGIERLTKGRREYLERVFRSAAKRNAAVW